MKWIEIEDGYFVSETGEIRGKLTNSLKTRVDRYGYEIVTLYINGKHITRKVHRLVAQAFIANPDNLPTVNHKDGIKTNNVYTNLEWSSVADNHRHAFTAGLHTVGEHRLAGRKVKLTNEDIYSIREMIANGLGNTEIGKFFGVSCGCIYSIRIGKSWTHI